MQNPWPDFKPLFTGPMTAGDDPENEWVSHLKRQATKTARYANSLIKGDRGGSIAAVGERGSGKSSWINFFEEALEASDKGKDNLEWITVRLSVERFEAAPPLRPVTYLLYEIAKAIREKTKNKKLEKYAAQVQMDKESAAQAAIAFADDDDDFVTKYGRMSLESGSALNDFACELKKALGESRRLLIILDDCDLLRRADDASALLFTSLYLTEMAPVLRIAATSLDGKSRLLGRRIKWMSSEEKGRLLWRILGEETSLSGMNNIRKMMFLRWPEQKATGALWDGLLVWSETLSDESYMKDGKYYISKDEGIAGRAVQRHNDVVREMVKADWEKGGKRNAGLYYQIVGKDLQINNSPAEPGLEERLAEALEKIEVEQQRKEYLCSVLDLFPANRREAVLLTNLLIRQRDQILNKEQPFDGTLNWATFPGRVIRLLMCVGYLRWPTTKLGKLLWTYPFELVDAFDGATLNEKEKTVVSEKALHELIPPFFNKPFEEPDTPEINLSQTTVDEQWKLMKLFHQAVNDPKRQSDAGS